MLSTLQLAEQLSSKEQMLLHEIVLVQYDQEFDVEKVERYGKKLIVVVRLKNGLEKQVRIP